MPHVHELIDFCADAFIVHGNKVLLIFHKKHQIWLPIGGHIELDEDPEEALLREIKEECGLEVEIIAQKHNINSKDFKSLPVPEFMDIHQVTPTHRHISMRYFCKAKSDKFTHNKEEHDDIRWFTLEELDSPDFTIRPDIKFYAKEALKRAK